MYKKISCMIKYFFYKNIQKLLHYFHLHYMPPLYPNGDVQIWCRWCGARYTIQRKSNIL